MARVFVGVGSNIDPAENVPAALRLLAKEVRVVATSLFYETLPLGRPEQPAFYNGVVEIATDLPPDDLRQLLRRIETQLGRRRSRDPYAARTIDLDLLLYEGQVCESPPIPDPEITERPFLALPLAELAPDLLHSGLQRPLREIAATLPHQDMKPLAELTQQLRKEIENGQGQG